jgi:hypothetical protein
MYVTYKHDTQVFIFEKKKKPHQSWVFSLSNLLNVMSLKQCSWVMGKWFGEIHPIWCTKRFVLVFVIAQLAYCTFEKYSAEGPLKSLRFVLNKFELCCAFLSSSSLLIFHWCVAICQRWFDLASRRESTWCKTKDSRSRVKENAIVFAIRPNYVSNITFLWTSDWTSSEHPQHINSVDSSLHASLLLLVSSYSITLLPSLILLFNNNKFKSFKKWTLILAEKKIF